MKLTRVRTTLEYGWAHRSLEGLMSRGADPACISHHPTVEAHDTTAMTSLFLRNACLPCSTYCSSTPARAFFLRPACASS
ncbi:MAG: hypothetical protein OXL36_04170 [Bryobacterales bacterium]|nr:hypothetical protein [Bryobacterales bacterium]